MKKSTKIEIGEVFRPDPAYKKVMYIYLIPVLIIIAIFSLVLYLILSFIPVVSSGGLSFLFRSPLEMYLPFIILGIAIIAAIFGVAYVKAYVNSITYKLTKSQVEWTRGVFGRYTGVVPYKKITNVDVVQGPLTRAFGIGAVKIQTAGYSAREAMAEIRIDGIRDFNGVKRLIMGQITEEK